MPRLILPAVALALVLASPAVAAKRVIKIDLFKLWNDCQPVHLVVESLPKDAADIGLTREAITVAVRSRLRAARLYAAGAWSWLYVNVNVLDQAFSISVEYKKWVKDTASGEEGTTGTWSTGSLGTHGSRSGYILSSVSTHVDRFIDEYLRVNADACRKSK